MKAVAYFVLAIDALLSLSAGIFINVAFLYGTSAGVFTTLAIIAIALLINHLTWQMRSAALLVSLVAGTALGWLVVQLALLISPHLPQVQVWITWP